MLTVGNRLRRHFRALAADSASLVENRKSTRVLRTFTRKLPTRSACKSKVRPRSTSAATSYFGNIVNDVTYTGKEAGLAFERAAAIQTKNLNEPDDAANTLVEAFKSYRKTDPQDAARVLDQAINHYTLKGNFRRAAGHKEKLAELYEVELGDQKRAIEAYEAAASWYESDNAEA